jgi:type IV pilus assembly protein PilB
MVQLPSVDLSTYLIDQKTLELVPASLASKYKLVPLFKIGNTLTVAIADPTNVVAIDDVRSATGLDVDLVTAAPDDIQQTITQYYGISGTVEQVLSEINKTTAKSLDAQAGEAPVVKLVNMFILQAVMEKASDIHIEPEEKVSRVRFRVDGILHAETELPLTLHPVVVSRIKILAGMDIAETRTPQDGRFDMKIEGRSVDIRVSSFPSVMGEKIVMRLLDKASMLLKMEDLGLDDEALAKFKSIITRPYGMILVTGPTGSGKTTTLYAALNALNSLEKNIMTVEDPVEYEIPGITQSQVNVKAGLTFANALRSILRQDPNVILIGEIRDLETAHIAIQAAMTGHLVFSTLHTNDAAGALTRLIDMGVEPFLVASSVIDIIAQRLVRKLCNRCQGKGCNVCRMSGFKGRIAIYEQLLVDDKISKLISEKAAVMEIRKTAVAAGMKPLREDGLNKVSKGITTKEEVMRVTALD